MKALERRQFSVSAPDDFWTVGMERFDCVVMNPPFSPMKVGYEILERSLSLSDRIIALMPWLTIINSARRTRLLHDFGIISVIHLPRKTFNGARVQCMILNMERGFCGPSEILFNVNPSKD